ncbi:MAG: acetylxylan esterase, partial [Lentisphaeria bacterium]|nr:acetylxylan esterase [Lentisphaeria bacterium]
MFRHWYCKAYDKYAADPAKLLTFDQHLLLAAVAPRKLLVAGFDDPWYDTEGEFLACKAASPAWEFLGRPGLPQVSFPEDFAASAIGPFLGYYRRSQKHGIAY